MSPREAGAHHRRKGQVGEREVTKAFEAAGGRVIQMEGQGDHLVELADVVYHVESKRRERIAILEWCRQAETEKAWEIAVPVVCFRPSREPWRVVLGLDAFLEIVT